MTLTELPRWQLRSSMVTMTSLISTYETCSEWQEALSFLDVYMILVVFSIVPQIAIAIGVLTSNTGGGRRTTLADWTRHQGAIAGCRVPLRGAIVACYGGGRESGAIAGCHCSVLWWGQREWCHCRVLWFGGEGDDQL